MPFTNAHLAVVAIAVVVLIVLVLYPAWRILRRLGLNPWLSLLLPLPTLNIILLWFVALARWPSVAPPPPILDRKIAL